MNSKDYWKECISDGAEECNLSLTTEQLDMLAEVVEGAHENYGMAFYSPPPSDLLSCIEKEYNQKLKNLQQEYNDYRNKSDVAIRKALNQYPDTFISIEEYGEVYIHNGRTVQIQ